MFTAELSLRYMSDWESSRIAQEVQELDVHLDEMPRGTNIVVYRRPECLEYRDSAYPP